MDRVDGGRRTVTSATNPGNAGHESIIINHMGEKEARAPGIGPSPSQQQPPFVRQPGTLALRWKVEGEGSRRTVIFPRLPGMQAPPSLPASH